MSITTSPLRYTPVFENVRTLGDILAPAGLEWERELPAGRRADYVLHLSCMAHYTPHIPYIAQKILALAGTDFVTLGGTESCCGALHEHFGDADLARAASTTGIAGFRRAQPGCVVSICPDCDESFNTVPAAARRFEVINISQLLVQLLPRLAPHFRPLARRVLLHEHHHSGPRSRDMANMETLLAAIPGVELVRAQSAQGPGAHCNILAPMPASQQAAMVDDARRLGADVIAVAYHSCYRQHCALEDGSLGVQHYLGLLAQSLGIPFEERYKELRLLGTVDKAVDRLRAEAAGRGIAEDTLRRYVQAAVFCY